MSARRPERRVRDETGMAMLTVILGMFALTLMVISTTTYVSSSMGISRQTQDSQAALQAAQAGVDDYLARLASCESYWQAPCPTSSPNPALAGWATVPLSNPAQPAQFTYKVVNDPAVDAGLVRLRSTGRIQSGNKPAKRTLVADLRKPSFLNYVYYTDKEAMSPQLVLKRHALRVDAIDPPQLGFNAIKYVGVPPAEAEKCNRYWYATSTTASRSTGSVPHQDLQLSKDGGKTWWNWNPSPPPNQVTCDIFFTPSDVIDGPLHTNDALYLNGPLFKKATRTSWAAGSTPAPDMNAWYRVTPSGTGPQSSGRRPEYAPPIALPPSNASLRELAAGAGGCLYTGPTSIVVRTDGKMDVTSPMTKATNAACTTKFANNPGLQNTQTVNLPANGVVFVQRATDACTGQKLSYINNAEDVTAYDCQAGDAFVQGQLNGRLTIAAFNDINVTGNLTYVGGTGTDVLGLVANDFVQIYHPLKCTYKRSASIDCEQWGNLVDLHDVTVHAAILSVRHSFTVQNYWRGPKLGTLNVLGGIYQAFRGPIGTGDGVTGTSYNKSYTYDTRLRTLSPPSFLNPLSAPWTQAGVAETRTPGGLPG